MHVPILRLGRGEEKPGALDLVGEQTCGLNLHRRPVVNGLCYRASSASSARSSAVSDAFLRDIHGEDGLSRRRKRLQVQEPCGT